MKRLSIFLLCLVAGCSPDANRMIQDNFELWNKAKPQAYDMQIVVDCTCSNRVDPPVEIRVRGDLFRVLQPGTENPIAADMVNSNPYVGSVDDVFAALFLVLQNYPAHITSLQFDDAFGYPQRFTLDSGGVHGRLEFETVSFKAGGPSVSRRSLTRRVVRTPVTQA